MSLTSMLTVFVVGALGGALLELLHWWNLRRRNAQFPNYAKSPFYWCMTILMILAGGLVAVLYFGEQAEAMIVLHVGITTPLILQKLTTTMASPGARSANEMRLVDFFTW